MILSITLSTILYDLTRILLGILVTVFSLLIISSPVLLIFLISKAIKKHDFNKQRELDLKHIQMQHDYELRAKELQLLAEQNRLLQEQVQNKES